MLADQRCPSGDPPGGAIIDRCLARVDKAAAELRVLNLFPEAAIMQVGVVEQRFRDQRDDGADDVIDGSATPTR